MKYSQNQNSSNLQKKDEVNRQSSVLFIHLGLVFALFLVFLAIEMKTPVYASNEVDLTPRIITDEEVIPEINLEQPKPKQSEPIPQSQLPDEIDIRRNDDNFIETNIIPIEPNAPVDIKAFVDNTIEINPNDGIDEDVPFSAIEDVPIFPGCHGNNDELRQCFEEKLKQHVNKKFNAEIAGDLGLPSGLNRIDVQFVIDKIGNITDVNIRAPHKGLENEARRVISLLPQMTPGKQRLEPVKVKYILPIRFMVE